MPQVPRFPFRAALELRGRIDCPGPDGRDAEVERILALGARRVDIGQSGMESWTVLADPEGNEFCILRPKTTLIA
jgi:hypothetical protein